MTFVAALSFSFSLISLGGKSSPFEPTRLCCIYLTHRIKLSYFVIINFANVFTAFAGKKILVTGGAGFIGSWLCDVLVDFGAKVTVADDLSTGRMQNIDHLMQNPKFKLIKADISAFESKEKFDFILHMAGHASPDEYQVHPIETLQTSSVGSANMAELARKNDATLLFASTSEVYGDAEVVPIGLTFSQ